MRLVVLMVILDRVLDRDDVPIEVAVDVVDHRRQRGGFARAGRPGYQEQPARAAAQSFYDGRQADLLERQNA